MKVSLKNGGYRWTLTWFGFSDPWGLDHWLVGALPACWFIIPFLLFLPCCGCGQCCCHLSAISNKIAIPFLGSKHQSHQDYLEKADKARSERLSSGSSSAKWFLRAFCWTGVASSLHFDRFWWSIYLGLCFFFSLMCRMASVSPCRTPNLGWILFLINPPSPTKK